MCRHKTGADGLTNTKIKKKFKKRIKKVKKQPMSSRGHFTKLQESLDPWKQNIKI